MERSKKTKLKKQKTWEARCNMSMGIETSRIICPTNQLGKVQTFDCSRPIIRTWANSVAKNRSKENRVVWSRYPIRTQRKWLKSQEAQCSTRGEGYANITWRQRKTKEEDKSAQKNVEGQKYQERCLEQHMLGLIAVSSWLFYAPGQLDCSQETLTQLYMPSSEFRKT